jgi:tRNA(fMet)-specific endonuclease VapC
VSSPRYHLDTDTCIYIANRRSAAVLKRLESLRDGEAAISVFTWGELAYGAAKSSQPKNTQATLNELQSVLAVLPLPPEAGPAYGQLRAAMQAAGRPIGGNDLWIAAHAKALGLVLVSNNTREFDRVAGLKVQNWM